MWQGMCDSIGSGVPYITRGNSAPLFIPKQFVGEQSNTLDAWTENDGALLKGTLNDVADACAQALLAELFK